MLLCLNRVRASDLLAGEVGTVTVEYRQWLASGRAHRPHRRAADRDHRLLDIAARRAVDHVDAETLQRGDRR